MSAYLLQIVETTEKIAEVLPELNVIVAVLLVSLAAPVLVVVIFAMLIRWLVVEAATPIKQQLTELVEGIAELNSRLGDFLERDRIDRIVRPPGASG